MIMEESSSSPTPAAVDDPSIGDRLKHSVESISGGEVSEGVASLVSDLLFPALSGLLALVAAYFFAKLVSRWLAMMVCRRIDETLGRFVSNLAFYSIILVVATIVLPIVGIQVSGLMAILATAGFAIGLAFQGTLSNFASGVLLLVFRPFKVGDLVNVAGIIGKVYEIDLFTTKLDTLDNRRLILPNSSISGNTIENVTYHKHRRLETTIGVTHSASLDQTRTALVAAAESMADWTIQGEGRGYQVLVSELTDTSVRWTVRVWVATDQFLAAKERLNMEIKHHLDQHQIGIPLPQLRIHTPSDVNFTSLGLSIETNTSERTDQPSFTTASLAIPNIHPDEDRGSRIRPRVRGASPNTPRDGKS